MNLLEKFVASDRDETLIKQIAANPSDNILELNKEQYEKATAKQKNNLIWLLEEFHTPEMNELLLDWLHKEGANNSDLEGDRAGNIADLLYILTSRNIIVPHDELINLFTNFTYSSRVIERAIIAAGCSADSSLIPLIASKLDSTSPMEVELSALALGRLRAIEYVGKIISQLSSLSDYASYVAFLVALELMNDRSVVGPLREWLLKAPPEKKREVHAVLARLTGYEPVLPLNASIDSTADAIDKAWSAFNDSLILRPRLDELKLYDMAEAQFTLSDTTGAIRIDYNPPEPNSTWPRWDKSLLISGQRIYNIGSDCGTCETYLRLIGWTNELAALQAQQVRLATENISELSQTLFQNLDPLIKELRSGHYVAMLLDMDIEQVSEATSSWWFKRRQSRDNPPPTSDSSTDWPGTAHFQLKTPIANKIPVFCALLPSQDLNTLNTETCTLYENAIREGNRPTALVLTWVEFKEVEGDYDERFLVGVVIDGHHKMTAYARQNVPARILAICRIEDTWGPQDNQAEWFLETTRPLKANHKTSK